MEEEATQIPKGYERNGRAEWVPTAKSVETEKIECLLEETTDYSQEGPATQQTLLRITKGEERVATPT